MGNLKISSIEIYEKSISHFASDYKNYPMEILEHNILILVSIILRQIHKFGLTK